MNTADLIAVRRKAEDSVADMPDGPLKIKAFEVILGSLLAGSPEAVDSSEAPRDHDALKPASSLSERIGLLAEEGFFAQPRGLSEIQSKLAEHGWHYAQHNLSTPLVRLVRQRTLRRLQVSDGGKKVWKYSLP